MIQFIWVIIGGIIAIALPERKPRQIAGAVALGAMLGLVPKDNILAGFLVLLIFVLRVNLGIGIMMAALFTWVGVALEPFADRFGSFLLNQPAIQSLLSNFFEMPLIAWTSLNNTIVLGEFIFGLILFWPLYAMARLICTAVFPEVEKKSPQIDSSETC